MITRIYHMARYAMLFVIALMAGSLITSCGENTSKVQVVKIGLTHGKNHSFTQALERFARQVEEETSGKYELRIFHSSQLGGEKEMQEMLTIGSLDLSLSGIVNTYEPLFAVFELPYLYEDRAHVLRVNSGEVMQEVSRSLNDHNIRLIGFYENGFRHISNSVRPVMKPEDVEGLMIRTPENPAQIETIRALGAIPAPMSFSELYTALLQGVVDGQENPLQNIWYGRMYEAQPYISKTYHIYNSVYVLSSLRFWDSLPERDREIFDRALKQSSEWQLGFMENSDRELEAKMKELGVEFTSPDLGPFEQKTRQAYEVIYDTYGPEAKKIVERIKSLKE